MARKWPTYSISMSRSEPRPRLRGFFYDGHSSARQAGELYLDNEGNLRIDGVAWQGCLVTEVMVPSRVGNTPLMLRFPDGALFETRDHHGVEQLRRISSPAGGRFSIHHLESKLRYALAAVLVLFAAGGAFLLWGLPALSNAVAQRMPMEFSVRLAGEVLEKMDAWYLDRSALPKDRRAELAQLFQAALPDDPAYPFKLHFRHGGPVGANAFALPDGSIIVTDELVALIESDKELLSVLYHEVGHVVHRHALRSALESMGVALFMVWLTGDLETTGDWVAVVPVLLVQTGYSRAHEWQADGYALEQMRADGYDPAHFADFMQKFACMEFLSGAYEGAGDSIQKADACPEDLDKHVNAVLARFEPPDAENDGEHAAGSAQVPPAEPDSDSDTGEEEQAAAEKAESRGLAILRQIFATHPPTLERVARFHAAAESR